MKITVFIGFLMILFSVNTMQAQIVRIENNGAIADSSGLSGMLDLNIYSIKNNSNFFRLGTGSQVEYHKKKHTLLSLNELRLIFAEEEKLENRGYQHFRYQRSLDSTITLEVFSQFQFDQVLRIQIRQLNGIGPRFQFFRQSQSKLFLGVHYMYEYEEEEVTGNINRDHRISSHFTYSIKLPKSAVHCIVYYQPKISDFTDYRVSGSATYSIELRKQLLFNIRGELAHDAMPVEGVTELTYTFVNGFSLTF